MLNKINSKSIYLKSKTTISNTERGWDKAMRNSHHLTSVPLVKWVLFFNSRDENKANMFMNEIIATAEPMKFDIKMGQMFDLLI